MTFDEDAHDADGSSHHASQGANTDWHGVAHGTSPDLGGTILVSQRANRRWDPREKARITAESFEAGANVSAVARRHGVSLGLLHYWRRTARDRGAFEPISIIPLAVEGSVAPPREADGIEIEIGGARVHVRGVIDGSALQIVFAALRGQ
nr:transposase [Sphingomonas populi]